ncbi:hypothetical protein [Actinacidiphila acidipaludis]|uniref:DUF4230 domain-containing protein n=1 Tax=Actinacidiphila acidipaludis TaxID=2873382 RepID=A0ABS7Q2I2_9ACTN|nr:hypothetical protein [Streptomyces acidipaludis]MBY8877347.1 hypothetical protein [Streptomyces acidipaludis]
MVANWVVLVALFCWLAWGLFVNVRRVVHRRRLPELSVTAEQLEMFQGQAFREICRRSAVQGTRVVMTEYFAQQGWNRADVMHIMREPLKHELIKVRGWRFGSYSVTPRGWDEYRSRFIWMKGDGAVRISADRGGFVVAVVNSDHGSAHGGYGNRADVSHQRLIDALRTDAATATPHEAARAQDYADDLSSAVEEQNADRTSRILGRINALLSTATTAFTLTRQLLPPHG